MGRAIWRHFLDNLENRTGGMNRKYHVNLVFRKKNADYSIEKVFKPLQPIFDKHFVVDDCYVPYYKVSLWAIISNIWFTFCKRKDINHITGVMHYCALLLPKKNTIITIHDLNLPGTGIKRKILMWLFVRFPVSRAGYITCITEATKRELLKVCPKSVDKISVIYNPISPEYEYKRKEFDAANPRILHIGTRDNKNLERVILALKDIKCHLVIVGNLNHRQLSLLKSNGISYTNKFRLTDQEILDEYLSCDIVSFPSLYEGFGMPIIEGQAVGRPVLTSNRAPMNEVSGDAVVYVNPEDVNSIHNGFLKIINNEELRSSLVTKGLDNVKRFAASNIAEQYMALYNRILSV